MNVLQIFTTIIFLAVFVQLFIVLNVYLYKAWLEYRRAANHQPNKEE